jgi:hypothetical protein
MVRPIKGAKIKALKNPVTEAYIRYVDRTGIFLITQNLLATGLRQIESEERRSRHERIP